MPFQCCPQCQKRTLAPTGAFWCCTDCDTAITSQALAAMRAAQHPRKPTIAPRSPLSLISQSLLHHRKMSPITDQDKTILAIPERQEDEKQPFFSPAHVT